MSYKFHFKSSNDVIDAGRAHSGMRVLRALMFRGNDSSFTSICCFVMLILKCACKQCARDEVVNLGDKSILPACRFVRLTLNCAQTQCFKAFKVARILKC